MLSKKPKSYDDSMDKEKKAEAAFFDYLSYEYGCVIYQQPQDRDSLKRLRLLKPYELDVRLKLNKTQQRNIELKSLTPRAFEMDIIHIGLIGKYDDKIPSIHYVMLMFEDCSWLSYVCPSKNK